jgi:UTP--glucose-1-phosphate uridylyltransferase
VKSDDTITIPFVIMTSGDTDSLTRKLLTDNKYYGMDPHLVTIVTQDKVAALKDGSTGLALDDNNRWTIQTKPHGHGDVHHLLYREGLIDQWEKDSQPHIIFIQDTLEAGQEAVAASSTAPGTMSSAESDLYVQNQRKLKHVGVPVPVSEYEDYVTLAAIPVVARPRIVLEPSFDITRKEYEKKIIGPMTIMQRSSVVLAGRHLTIKKLDVDGALVKDRIRMLL